MAHVIFYEKPGCGGNARQKKTLSDSGHELVVRDLLSHPWSGAELLAFLAPLPPADWFNRAAPKIKSGEIVPENLGPGKALALLMEDHLLIRRPLMQVGDQRMVGWDEAKVAAWIGLDGAAGIGEGCPKHDHAPKCEPPAA
ncbi:thioredoxin domain-containing protein [Magnetospirillum gryphiswaldense]|uniref:Nitrogenase-associated protein n=2 Tax=Magnetospirillum gryphiswaldense TaxID=55518 RepID=V6EZA6_MAGGM|nr:nitrogenase-associated protein [Magnetospirillum gryphiswaldense]CAM76155.1 Nitrogenase-associated protein [Magnetospirillum gryphiswaldense MSR-1]CDK97563.1 putative nitrogenase-associated protein [Magnetospirillum gryphiswaldense MSR-1 v2]